MVVGWQRLAAPEGRCRPSGACMPHSWIARGGLDSIPATIGASCRHSNTNRSSSRRQMGRVNANDDGKIVSKTKCVCCIVFVREAWMDVCMFWCRMRQQIEAEYYKEWERLTVVSEEELNRKMTVVTFLRFLPMWLRYNGLPGPLRYILFQVMPWEKILGRFGFKSSSAAGISSDMEEEEGTKA